MPFLGSARIPFLALLVALAGCAGLEDAGYRVAGGPALRILDPGQPPPSDCTSVGVVDIPQRPVGIVTIGGIGYDAKDFYRALHYQLAPLGATLVIPDEGSDPMASASTGKPFHGVAYSCR
jgi:hypothetical protein